MKDKDYHKLSNKIDGLLQLCEMLKKKNKMLLVDRDKWRHECAHLSYIKDQAKMEVEAMIARLRGLEK